MPAVRPAAARFDPKSLWQTRRVSFSSFLYRHGNRAGRLFSNLKHYRAVAIRCEKPAAGCFAAVKLAATRIRLRHHEPATWFAGTVCGDAYPGK